VIAAGQDVADAVDRSQVANIPEDTSPGAAAAAGLVGGAAGAVAGSAMGPGPGAPPPPPGQPIGAGAGPYAPTPPGGPPSGPPAGPPSGPPPTVPSTTPSWSSGPPTYAPTSPGGYGAPSGGYPAGGAPSGGFPSGGVGSGGYPPAGPPSGGYGAPPSGSNRGVLYAVLGGVAAVALIVVLIVAFSGGGGDDDDTTGGSTTTTTGQQQSSTTTGGGSSTSQTITVTTLTPTQYEDVLFGCAAGDMADCDTLYRGTPSGSALEAISLTCGNHDPAGGHRGNCESSFGADGSGAPDSTTSTTEAADESLRQACVDGDNAACDDLYYATPTGSAIEAVAKSCGYRDPGGTHTGSCEEELG
jgi:hypothetical protein